MQEATIGNMFVMLLLYTNDVMLIVNSFKDAWNLINVMRNFCTHNNMKKSIIWGSQEGHVWHLGGTISSLWVEIWTTIISKFASIEFENNWGILHKASSSKDTNVVHAFMS